MAAVPAPTSPPGQADSSSPGAAEPECTRTCSRENRQVSTQQASSCDSSRAPVSSQSRQRAGGGSFPDSDANGVAHEHSIIPLLLKLPKEHHSPFFPALSPLLKVSRAGGIRRYKVFITVALTSTYILINVIILWKTMKLYFPFIITGKQAPRVARQRLPALTAVKAPECKQTFMAFEVWLGSAASFVQQQRDPSTISPLHRSRH